jgi:hypothetical protein
MDEICVHGPGNGIGTYDVTPPPTVGNRIKLVLGRAIEAAVRANGAVDEGMQSNEAVGGMIAEKGRKEGALERVGVDANANDSVGSHMEAKDKDMLRT